MESQDENKDLVWLIRGSVKTPPFSASARIEAGILLRMLQNGEILAMPVSRPMPSISPHCHELRIDDSEINSGELFTGLTQMLLSLQRCFKKLPRKRLSARSKTVKND